MFDQRTYSAHDALDMIETGMPPLLFETGVAVYRAAVKRIAKTTIPGMITSDLSAIPMSLSFIDMMFEQLNQVPYTSKKEREARGQWKSRLKTIARRLEDVPVVRTTDSWDYCLDILREHASSQGMKDQALIPIVSTLRAAAVGDGLEPSQMTQQWLITTISKSGEKRRGSLKKAAQLLDDFWPELPAELRPIERFGLIELVSSQRDGRPLPPRLAAELEVYLAGRVAGVTAEGFNRTVTVQAGINERESTPVYRQATGWFYDCLCEVGELDPEADIGMIDLCRLDWLGKVTVEALADIDTDNGEAKVFPWDPIGAKAIYNRVSSLNTMFGTLYPAFLLKKYELHDPTAHVPEIINAKGLLRILSQHRKQEMTDAHRAFCRTIVLDEEKQRLLLNMHMICWAEAEGRWNTYDRQSHHDQMRTMNICILSALLAIVVHIPFRARTVTSIVMNGTYPDLSFPKGGKQIEFHVAPKQMKVTKRFDAVLEDTKHSRPRQIIDWFIAGPRQELLRDSKLLPSRNRRPDRLFCGVGRARYNRILSDWTEEMGLRMTTHLFRHALASILVNCCESRLEDVARLLGNTVATAERQYVFQDLIRRRDNTLRKLEERRVDLTETHHPGRRKRHE